MSEEQLKASAETETETETETEAKAKAQVEENVEEISEDDLAGVAGGVYKATIAAVGCPSYSDTLPDLT